MGGGEEYRRRGYERGYHEIFIKRSTGWGEEWSVSLLHPVARASSTLSFEDVVDGGLPENYANHGRRDHLPCGSREKLVS